MRQLTSDHEVLGDTWQALVYTKEGFECEPSYELENCRISLVSPEQPGLCIPVRPASMTVMTIASRDCHVDRPLSDAQDCSKQTRLDLHIPSSS